MVEEKVLTEEELESVDGGKGYAEKTGKRIQDFYDKLAGRKEW